MRFRGLVLGALISLAQLCAHGQNIMLTPQGNNLYLTGVNNNNLPIPVTATNITDPHYVISSSFNAPNASGAFIPTPPANTVLPPGSPAYLEIGVGGYYTPLHSHWIDPAPVAAGTFMPATFFGSDTVFNYTLTLTNIPAGVKVTITSGYEASDDQVYVTANGSSAAFSDSYKSGAQPHNYTVGSAITTFSFISGTTNTLDFQVANTGGGITGLDVDALAGYYAPLTSSAGIVLTAPPGLTPNQTSVLNQINALNAAGAGNACFAQLTAALIGLNANQFGPALDELSPQRLDLLKSIAINNASFMTQDLDDYLAHRRDSNGDFIASPAGFDASGLTVGDSTLAPGLVPIYSHLLAWSPAPSLHHLVSDASDPVMMAAASPPSYLPHWNTFLRGNVTLGQNFSTQDLDHTGYTTSSFAIGTDYQFTDDFLLGGLLSYDHTDTGLDAAGGSATVDSYSPGIYAAFARNGWYSNALASYTHNAYTEQRDIAIGSFQQTPSAAPEGSEELADLDGGYDYHHKGFTYGPTLGFQYIHWNMDSFSETGGCSTDLAVGNQDTDSFRSRLGGHVSYSVKKYGVVFTPYLDASWQHEFLDDSRQITSSFTTLSPGTFTVVTDSPSRDSALVVAGLNLDFNETATAFLDYQMQAGQADYFGQQVQAGMKFAF